jgi:hypothetical protein
VAVSKTFRYEGDSQAALRAARSQPPHPAVVSAVKEDIRQTLRTAWIDPFLEVTAQYPIFFTSAWSAIRPNVGKSFLALARSLRTEAADAMRSSFPHIDLRKDLEGTLADEELHRVEDSARAAHIGVAKSQIVAHALYRAARRERIPGTGGEEPPIRRGIPEWQRWMSIQPGADETKAVLEDAVALLAVPSAPLPLGLFARWPHALTSFWAELRTSWGTEEWNAAVSKLRRVVLAGISTLPHPVELQWGALQARGFDEEERTELVERLAAYEAMMPAQTLAAALAWTALGAPDIGGEA